MLLKHYLIKNVFLFKKEARTSKKVGVEHASKEVLEKALENVVTYKKSLETLSYDEYSELGLVGKNDIIVIEQDKN